MFKLISKLNEKKNQEFRFIFPEIIDYLRPISLNILAEEFLFKID